MHEHKQMDAKLVYWIEKYFLLCGTQTMSYLAQDFGSSQIRCTAASQDTIDWVEFLHGKVSVAIAKIQEIHCKLSSCQIISKDWMKHFIANCCGYCTLSGYTGTSPCTTTQGTICIYNTERGFWRRWTAWWIKIRMKPHKAASIYWKWTSHTCVTPHLRGSPIGC